MEKYKISHKKLMLISSILTSSSIEEACSKANISRAAYYKWLKEADFKHELACQRNEVVQESLNKLKISIKTATDEMIRLMTSSREDIRRLVCRDIVGYALKCIELDDIENRLDKIEKIVFKE